MSTTNRARTSPWRPVRNIDVENVSKLLVNQSSFSGTASVNHLTVLNTAASNFSPLMIGQRIRNVTTDQNGIVTAYGAPSQITTTISWTAGDTFIITGNPYSGILVIFNEGAVADNTTGDLYIQFGEDADTADGQRLAPGTGFVWTVGDIPANNIFGFAPGPDTRVRISGS